MRHFIHLFLNDHRWFVGTTLALILLFVFFWGMFCPESLAAAWNRFALLLGEIFKGIIMIALIILGFRIMLKKTGKKSGSH